MVRKSKDLFKLVKEIDLTPTRKNLKNNKIMQYTFEVADKKNQWINKNIAQKYIKTITDELYKNGMRGYIQILGYFGMQHWYSGLRVSLGDEAEFWEEYDTYDGIDNEILAKGAKSDDINSFSLIIEEFRPAGAANKNDCLFEAITEILGDLKAYKFKKEIRSNCALKKFFNLERSDSIPFMTKDGVNNMEKLDMALPDNIGLNIAGEHKYQSKKQDAVHQITLRWANGHITPMNNIGRVTRKDIIFYKNRPMIVYKSGQYLFTESIDTYDGKFLKTYTRDEFDILRNNYKINKVSSMSLKICNKSLGLTEKDEHINELIATYDLMQKAAADVSKHSNGKLNISDFSSFKYAAISIFNSTTKAIAMPDNIDDSEAEFINGSLRGGLRYCQRAYSGYGKDFDINKMYSHIMRLSKFKFPLKRGHIKYMNEDEFNMQVMRKYFNFGIFRVNIIKSNDINIDKLFQFSKINMYSHHDLTGAFELGLKIEFIDIPNNRIFYDGDMCVTGKRIFGDYINKINELVKSGCTGSKLLLNTLWGGLCQRNIYEQRAYKCDILDDDKRIVNYKADQNDGSVVFEIAQENLQFKTPFARLGVFLTSYARLIIMRTLKNVSNSVVLINTDGFILNENIPLDIKISPEMGDYKIVAEGQCKIHHIHKIEWL